MAYLEEFQNVYIKLVSSGKLKDGDAKILGEFADKIEQYGNLKSDKQWDLYKNIKDRYLNDDGTFKAERVRIEPGVQFSLFKASEKMPPHLAEKARALAKEFLDWDASEKEKQTEPVTIPF